MDNFVGFEEEVKEEVKAVEMPKPEEPKKVPYAVWKVGTRELKLKLATSDIINLEQKFKKNLLAMLAEEGMPPLATMLTIIHAASNKYEHGVKRETVLSLFDEYVEQGGTQMTLLEDVIIPIFEVSGFFTEEQKKTMMEE